jgi:hypothetical protein
MRFFRWFAGFFEDQKGSASSKRGTLYYCLFLLYMLTKGSLEGSNIDHMLLFGIIGLILFLVGAVTSEFFNKFPRNK